jgi:hypothetical protein
MSQTRIELPPKYYLTYFEYLLKFVGDKYDHILNDKENAFIQSFASLTEDEKCLFVRFTNRKGSFFKTDRLNYTEINNIPDVIISLKQKGFLLGITNNQTSLFNNQYLTDGLLEIFTKAELLTFLKQLKIDIKGLSGLKKEEILDFCITQIDQYPWQSVLPQTLVRLGYEVETMMLKFLFFGNRHAEMTEFVIRDLGIMKYQSFDEDTLVAQFATRQEAEDRLLVSLAKEDFYTMQEATIEPKEIFNWFMDWSDKHHKTLSDSALSNYERLIIRLGTYLEKQKVYEEALIVFRLTKLTPSRERQARILQKINCIDEARSLCELLLGDFQNADERFFAIDFLEKLNNKKRSKKSVTLQLHNSESISIPLDWKYQVEAGVIDYYEQQGSKAFFAENHLWRSIFGLLFWDIIFDTKAMAIHHPLQRSPSDLYKPIFWENRRNRLIERLEILENPADWQVYIEQVFVAHFGVTNPLVEWFPGIFQAINTVLSSIEPHKIAKIMLEMAKNMKENTRGFPDLFVWDTDSYSFVEVKSPSDNLSNQQLYWLHFFEQIGINSKVLRVTWNTTELLIDTE